MKKFALRPLVAALVLTAPVMSAFATDGYFSHGYGMKAKGMGGAATAYTDSAFAGANNPALSSWAGNRTELGLDWFSPKRSATAAMAGNATVTSDSTSFLIPEFGYNRTHDAKWSYGITVYGNGGMSSDYPTSPVGSPTNDAMGVDLQQLIVAPTISYKLDESQSVGVSPLLVFQTINIKGISHFAQMSAQGGANLSNKGTSTSNGMGVRLGYFAKMNDRLDLGVSYSPKTKMGKFDEYTGLFNSSFDIPENFNIGVAFKAAPTVKVLADYGRINYNGVKAIGAPTTNLTLGQQPLGSAGGAGFGWSNINVLKLGVEWRQTAALVLRAGYNRSDNPIQSRDVTFNIMAPGLMTTHYTFGGTYELAKDSELTFAYMLAPEGSVTGSNLFAGNPQMQLATTATDTIRMKQQSFGVQYAWKY